MTRSLNASDGVWAGVARSLAIDAHTAEVVTALRSAEVPSVLLKGPSLARWLYTDGTARPYGDTDLLVPDERMADVERVLEGLGLVRRVLPTHDLDPRHHAKDWQRPDGSGHLDLHWTLPLVGAPAAVWPVVFGGAERMTVAGCEVWIESEPMRALHVALHAAHHGPAHAKPLEDLRRAISQASADTWVAARALADDLDAVAPMALGLRLLPEGAELASRLSVDAAGATPEFVLRAQGRSAGAQTVARILDEPSWVRRAHLAWRRVVPSVAFIRAWDEQQRGIAGGSLVGAYVRRLRFVLTTAPAAVGSYLRLRRRPGKR